MIISNTQEIPGKTTVEFFGLVSGSTVRMVERMHTRVFEEVEDCFFVDAGLSYDDPVYVSAATKATPVVITATFDSDSRFLKGDQGVSSKAIGTATLAAIKSPCSSRKRSTSDQSPVSRAATFRWNRRLKNSVTSSSGLHLRYFSFEKGAVSGFLIRSNFSIAMFSTRFKIKATGTSGWLPAGMMRDRAYGF